MSDEQEFRMVMPFVAVKTNGGPFDDEAYCAGWEMGKLDTELTITNSVLFAATIRRDNLPQADLVAMRRGWTLADVQSGDDGTGWAQVSFVRAGGS